MEGGVSANSCICYPEGQRVQRTGGDRAELKLRSVFAMHRSGV